MEKRLSLVFIIGLILSHSVKSEEVTLKETETNLKTILDEANLSDIETVTTPTELEIMNQQKKDLENFELERKSFISDLDKQHANYEKPNVNEDIIKVRKFTK